MTFKPPMIPFQLSPSHQTERESSNVFQRLIDRHKKNYPSDEKQHLVHQMIEAAEVSQERSDEFPKWFINTKGEVEPSIEPEIVFIEEKEAPRANGCFHSPNEVSSFSKKKGTERNNMNLDMRRFSERYGYNMHRKRSRSPEYQRRNELSRKRYCSPRRNSSSERRRPDRSEDFRREERGWSRREHSTYSRNSPRMESSNSSRHSFSERRRLDRSADIRREERRWSHSTDSRSSSSSVQEHSGKHRNHDELKRGRRQPSEEQESRNSCRKRPHPNRMQEERKDDRHQLNEDENDVAERYVSASTSTVTQQMTYPDNRLTPQSHQNSPPHQPSRLLIQAINSHLEEIELSMATEPSRQRQSSPTLLKKRLSYNVQRQDNYFLESSQSSLHHSERSRNVEDIEQKIQQQEHREQKDDLPQKRNDPLQQQQQRTNNKSKSQEMKTIVKDLAKSSTEMSDEQLADAIKQLLTGTNRMRREFNASNTNTDLLDKLQKEMLDILSELEPKQNEPSAMYETSPREQQVLKEEKEEKAEALLKSPVRGIEAATSANGAEIDPIDSDSRLHHSEGFTRRYWGSFDGDDFEGYPVEVDTIEGDYIPNAGYELLYTL